MRSLFWKSLPLTHRYCGSSPTYSFKVIECRLYIGGLKEKNSLASCISHMAISKSFASSELPRVTVKAKRPETKKCSIDEV